MEKDCYYLPRTDRYGVIPVPQECHQDYSPVLEWVVWDAVEFNMHSRELRAT